RTEASSQLKRSVAVNAGPAGLHCMGVYASVSVWVCMPVCLYGCVCQCVCMGVYASVLYSHLLRRGERGSLMNGAVGVAGHGQCVCVWGWWWVGVCVRFCVAVWGSGARSRR